MSNATAIKVEDLGKRYRIGERERYLALRDVLTETFSAPFRFLTGRGRSKERRPDLDFWALRHVSLEVECGEILGIIGRNGAGKTTLLKLLSRITEPTEGRAEIHGRVGSLLEVGTGFHPELTGRENIYLNGAILGMAKVEIDRKFDQIVSFAEVDKFVDTPVKRYSSGMYVRLAFAVAAHLEPEILLIDEVLAVGDAAFQKKCLGKMGDVAHEGRTILFVSHNMVAVESLCTRAILLEEGRVVDAGQPRRVVSEYLKSSMSNLTQQTWDDPQQAPGNEAVRLHRAAIRLSDPSADGLTVRSKFEMIFEYWNLKPGARLNLSLHVYNELGIMAFNTGPIRESVWQGKPFPAGLFRSVCHVPGDLLNNGMHRVELLVVKDQGSIIYQHDEALVFDVRDDVEFRGSYHGEWPGVLRPDLEWRTEMLGEGVAERKMAVTQK